MSAVVDPPLTTHIQAPPTLIQSKKKNKKQKRLLKNYTLIHTEKMTTDTCILECVRVGIVKSGLYKPDLQPDFSNWLLRTIFD